MVHHNDGYCSVPIYVPHSLVNLDHVGLCLRASVRIHVRAFVCVCLRSDVRMFTCVCVRIYVSA